ncbi:hypothetical protein FRC12_002224 [Ceratobasidium sp. 428]|nr:hypothetical protein FRC12_002224 [Ceratobasidium sp. 428]
MVEMHAGIVGPVSPEIYRQKKHTVGKTHYDTCETRYMRGGLSTQWYYLLGMGVRDWEHGEHEVPRPSTSLRKKLALDIDDLGNAALTLINPGM